MFLSVIYGTDVHCFQDLRKINNELERRVYLILRCELEIKIIKNVKDRIIQVKKMSHRKKYLLCVTGGACLGYYSIFVHCRRGSGKKTVMMKRTMTIANILQTVTPKTRTRTPAIILHKELFLFGGHANLQSVLRHIQGEINAVEAYFYITEEEEL